MTAECPCVYMCGSYPEFEMTDPTATVAQLTQYDVKRAIRAIRAMFRARGHRVVVKKAAQGDVMIRGCVDMPRGTKGFDAGDVATVALLRELGILQPLESFQALNVYAHPDEIQVPPIVVACVAAA